MTLDTKALGALAQAATPGPWQESKGDGLKNVIAGAHAGGLGIAFDALPDDACFIAAASPSTVLALLSRLERAEEALRFYAEPKHYNSGGAPGYARKSFNGESTEYDFEWNEGDKARAYFTASVPKTEPEENSAGDQR